MPTTTTAFASSTVSLGDDVLDQIDAAASPGTDAGPMGALYEPPAVTVASLRRRPVKERAAA